MPPTVDAQPVNQLSSPRRPRWRNILDLLTTVAMLVAATIVIWTYISRGIKSSTARPIASPTVPDQPVSIKGSALIGDPNAPIAMIEYLDFQCPYCSRFVRETWPALKQEFVQTGDLVVAIKHLPLQRLHPQALIAAAAGECGRQQSLFWGVHDWLFDHQSQIDVPSINEAARVLGLDIQQFDGCMKNPQTMAAIEAEVTTANGLGIGATPGFLIGKLSSDETVRVSRMLSGARSIQDFREIFKALRSSSSQ